MSYLGKEEIKFNRRKDPHGWIQWKGTDVCIDIHCKCGELSHYDGDFMYFIQCPYCNKIYEANGFIKLHEISEKKIRELGYTNKIKIGDK